MKTILALFGAAGKMGTRISRRLQNSTEFQTLYVEAGDAAQAALRQRGLEPSDPHTAARQADVLVLAIPDKLIGKVSREMVPLMKAGAMMILLDPAAQGIAARVERVLSFGAASRIELTGPNGQPLEAELGRDEALALNLQSGQQVKLNASRLSLFEL